MTAMMRGLAVRVALSAASLLLAGPAHAGIFAAYTDAGGMSAWKDPFCQEIDDGYAIDLVETWSHLTPSIFLVEENSFSAFEGGAAGLTSHLLIDKNVVNMTGFDLTGWIINITPNPGASIKLINAFSNRFDGVTLTEFGDGSAQIVFSMDGDDTKVLTGETLKMEFAFQVNGGLGFTIKQTPVPTPGAIALLGAAGLMGARRRRRNL